MRVALKYQAFSVKRCHPEIVVLDIIQETRRSRRSARLDRSCALSRISRNIRPAIVSSPFDVDVLVALVAPLRAGLDLPKVVLEPPPLTRFEDGGDVAM